MHKSYFEGAARNQTPVLHLLSPPTRVTSGYQEVSDVHDGL